MLQFQQHCNRTTEISAYIFLWLTYCKSEVKLYRLQKVMEETVAEETVVEGTLVERCGIKNGNTRNSQ